MIRLAAFQKTFRCASLAGETVVKAYLTMQPNFAYRHEDLSAQTRGDRLSALGQKQQEGREELTFGQALSLAGRASRVRSRCGSDGRHRLNAHMPGPEQSLTCLHTRRLYAAETSQLRKSSRRPRRSGFDGSHACFPAAPDPYREAK
jgi:hypothetical protein